MPRLRILCWMLAVLLVVGFLVWNACSEEIASPRVLRFFQIVPGALILWGSFDLLRERIDKESQGG